MTQIYVDRPHAVLLPIEHQLIRTTKRNEGCHLTSPTRSIWVSTPQEILSQLYFKHTNKTRGRLQDSEEEDITSIGRTKIRKEAAFELPLQRQGLDRFASSYMERKTTQSANNKNPGPVWQNHNKYIVQLRVAR